MDKRITKSAMVLLALLLLTGCSSNTPVTGSPSPTQTTLVQTTTNIIQTTQPPIATSSTPAPTIHVGINVGDLAPDFNLKTLAGDNISLSGLRGKPVLVNLWATWCGPCKIEMPYLQQIHDTWSSKGLVVLEIDLIGSRPTETEANLANFMLSNNYTFTVPMDTQKTVTKAYALTAVPDSYFIDKDGIIRFKKIGNFSDKESIENALKTIMP